MHLNYYFLCQLSRQLDKKLKGWRLAACFSQVKDELIMGFSSSREAFYIKAHLDATFCCLSFPSVYHRAQKNSIDLFAEVLNKKVLLFRQLHNERSFIMELEEDYQVLFKMHGNRSNILLYPANQPPILFKKNLIKDQSIKLTDLDRQLEQDFDAFLASGDYQKLFPTFGSLIRQYLESLNYFDKNPQTQWKILVDIKEKLEKPTYYITLWNKIPTLSLLDIGEVIKKNKDPIDAANTFFYVYTEKYNLNQKKAPLLKMLKNVQKRSQNYILKTDQKLAQIEKGLQYEQIGDIIMANLHQIPPQTEQVSLFDFYNNRMVDIVLKPSTTPQKNAEWYYRKGKNQKIEIQTLKQNLQKKRSELKKTLEHIDAINAIDQWKVLKKYLAENNLSMVKGEGKEMILPYRKLLYKGFDILIGKNAKSNDLLTQKFTHKNDLWLHAKDVNGAHVVIKQKPGTPFPKHVIEKAAQLAAYYSKGKHNTLCPVIYTLKKFVRKPKGGREGYFIVEKEKVILAEPKRESTL